MGLSVELSDTRRLGSRHCPPDASETRRRYPADEVSRSRWRGKAANRVGAWNGNETETPRQRDEHPKVPSADTVGGEAGRNPRKTGDLRRTRPRRRICIRRAGRRTRKAPFSRLCERGRTLEGTQSAANPAPARTVPPTVAARWKGTQDARGVHAAHGIFTYRNAKNEDSPFVYSGEAIFMPQKWGTSKIDMASSTASPSVSAVGATALSRHAAWLPCAHITQGIPRASATSLSWMASPMRTMR